MEAFPDIKRQDRFWLQHDAPGASAFAETRAAFYLSSI